MNFPRHARVVIIGGGIVGCSIAYHLAKSGCRDVVLIEQHVLSSGSTWHAAGAVGQLRSSANVTRLLGESIRLYAALEAETGMATGWVRNGSLRLAMTKERQAEYEISATMARSFGLEFDFLGPSEIKAMVPQMKVDDLRCAAFLASDGVANPSDITQALARGARSGGVAIFERTRVAAINVVNGRVRSVDTDSGTVDCEAVVNCAGIWSPEIGALAGVSVPVQPAHHQYFVTDRIEGLQRHIPTIRDTDKEVYFKEEVGGLIVGFYEPNPIPYREYPIPPGHEFKLMPENVAQVEPFLDRAYHRFPALETVGVKRWFNGIESFTEDGMFILGEAPEVAGFFIATGFNAFGIASAGGAGLAMAHWILEGAPPFDLWPVDIRRFGGFHRSRNQVMVRAQEGQSRHFAMHWPHFETSAGRPLRTSSLYPYLKTAGACFGSKFGWERANWFAPADTEPRDQYTFERPGWFRHVAVEHRACREAVAAFDLSSFAKFLLLGRGAETALQRICAANVATSVNVATYTQMLNGRGGIEADLTVTRLSEDRYLIVTGTGYATRDAHHIRRSLSAADDVHLVDVTSAYGCLSLMGPRAPDLLATIVEGEIDDASFPFGSAQSLFVDGAPVLALRVSFVGERGWELFVPSEYLPRVYGAVKKAGEPFGLKDAGYRAIDSLRLEKARRIWGADIGPDYTPLEAGLGFAVDLNKPVFVGRDALLAQRDSGHLKQRLATFTVNDPEVTLYGRETIYRDGKRVGWLTSAGFGHTVGLPIGLGYVRHATGVDKAFLAAGRYELEVRTRRVAATLNLRPPYDPDNRRVR